MNGRTLTLVSSLVLAAGGCPALDVGQPIALVPESSWSATEVETLERAAECWNLEFGTRLEVGQGEAPWPQEVQIKFNEHICVYALGRTNPNLPVSVMICPMRHFFDSPSIRVALLFETLLHELGHVLNVRTHATGAWNVMGSGREKREQSDIVLPRFTDDDRQLFREANPDFVPDKTCEVAVDRYLRPPICGCVP